MNRRTGRGNRWGLALTGIVLALLGGCALARGMGAFGRNAAGTAIADRPVRFFLVAYSPWIWWVVALVAVIVALLGLRWLFVQGRRDSRDSLRMETGPGGVTDVTAKGMAAAVAADVATSPAVLDAGADLGGSRDRLMVRLRLVADEQASMSELRDHLAGVAIPHMRSALEADRVPAVARVTLEPAPTSHRVVH
ncbi:alkaline shock response membrane anchor protein AmaP [Nonomuraea sp. NEAU-A123]|uniref:alkaline shock response membrane anchor protein AmaP n=1 Tax=Nonomuraea sp. NEAU-A123 TaxID=2839649 RepID=UPI001BE4B84F|nr:alkaline shock response membrane anchor protein AmaP [Nonomuraea sp. NEAU-A123]MBT2228000.1 alkaline shock response membrane anchor protein AmaP [Nonomuraea sp. NEAU-A123]